nr:helix-turn-helix transcriptional regulator [uncultured Oscillibacter sp.]
MEHTERIMKILEEQNITGYRLSKEIGISKSLTGKWKEKPSSKVSSSILVSIADYLDCSVDYLLGRTDNPEMNK